MGIAKMKVYEVGIQVVDLADSVNEDVEATLWIRTDREITIVQGSDATYCKEIDIPIDAAGIDLNIE